MFRLYKCEFSSVKGKKKKLHEMFFYRHEILQISFKLHLYVV